MPENSSDGIETENEEERNSEEPRENIRPCLDVTNRSNSPTFQSRVVGTDAASSKVQNNNPAEKTCLTSTVCELKAGFTRDFRGAQEILFSPLMLRLPRNFNEGQNLARRAGSPQGRVVAALKALGLELPDTSKETLSAVVNPIAGRILRHRELAGLCTTLKA